MSTIDDRSRKSPTLTRRGLLKCAAWAGAGVVWTLRGGVLQPTSLIGAANAAERPSAGTLSFVQICDSHIGFI
jgi:hypothetical protein